jgi:TonB family protein
MKRWTRSSDCWRVLSYGMVFFFALTLSLSSLTSGEEPIEQLLQHIHIFHDEETKATIYWPDVDEIGADILFYPRIISLSEGKRMFRLRVCRRGPDWMNLDSLNVLADGERFDVHIISTDKVERHTLPGVGVMESVSLSGQDELIRRIANANHVSVSLRGSTPQVEEHDLLPEDLNAFRLMVRLYDMPILPEGNKQSSQAKENSGPFYAGAGGVSNPVIIAETKLAPKYPAKARKMGLEGRVILLCIVQKDGSIGEIQVRKSPPSEYGFDEAAIQAVKQWRYKPCLKDGEPVDAYFVVVVDFKLPK